jgi:aspartate/methionine/tyrosine aminotransferase
MALTEYLKRGIATDTIKPYISQMTRLYQTAAERTVQAIREHLKLPCLVPQGGLYTVIRAGMESSEFTRLVLEKTGVIVVPGWGFGQTLKEAVRVSYGPLVHNLDKIDLGMKKVGDFLATAPTAPQAKPFSEERVPTETTVA